MVSSVRAVARVAVVWRGPLGVARGLACEICAKTRGVSALTGHGGTFGIEDVWDRVGSCVWRAYDCTGYAKTRTCGIVRVGFVRTRNRE